MSNAQRAVVTVLGRDQKGIIAHVSRVLWEHGVNIVDLSQTVMGDIFHMVMMVELGQPDAPFGELTDALRALGERLGLQIRMQRSEIFDAMHQI